MASERLVTRYTASLGIWKHMRERLPSHQSFTVYAADMLLPHHSWYIFKRTLNYWKSLQRGIFNLCHDYLITEFTLHPAILYPVPTVFQHSGITHNHNLAHPWYFWCTFRCCKNFIFADLFDLGNVKRAFKTTFKRRPFNVRPFLLILVSVLVIMDVQHKGPAPIGLLFFRKVPKGLCEK